LDETAKISLGKEILVASFKVADGAFHFSADYGRGRHAKECQPLSELAIRSLGNSPTGNVQAEP
jgi:hypothetical protein